MDEDFFTNPSQLEHQSTIPTWQNPSSLMEIQPTQSSHCFLPSIPSFDHFGAPISSNNFLLKELICTLGSICNSSDIGVTNTCSDSNSNYNTLLIKENLSSMGNSIDLGSALLAMPGSPGIAERAMRFTSIGSNSFNGRTYQFSVNNNNVGVGYRSNNNGNLIGGGNGILQIDCSSPSLDIVGNCTNEMNQSRLINSREDLSVCCQNPSGEIGQSQNRKRKASPKGKSKEYQYNLGGENGEESSGKRRKSKENGIEEKKREEKRGDEGKKESNLSSEKTAEEPHKDYIHVRARRGQATDSHSLSERIRREKIGERMKFLQDLVPGCNKVIGKALMLDEIINYVQSLQRQVEFLSMKLAYVNPRLEFNVNKLLPNDHVIQQNCSMPYPVYPMQSLTPTLYGQLHQNALQNISSTLTNEGSMVPFSMDPLNPNSNQNHALQLPPPINGFCNVISQVSTLCEGDLQSIVETSYGQKEKEFQSQHLNVSNQTSLMKIEF